MSAAPIYPLVDGKCPRCGSPGQDVNVFCNTCSLRLAYGLYRLEAQAANSSAAWMEANPEFARAWRVRLDDPEAEAPGRRDEVDAALADLATCALEARVLAQVVIDAEARLQAALARCRAVGAPASAMTEIVTGERVPGLRPRPAPPAQAAAAGGSGFAFFYAEAGIDADGDGDVDGGLVDALTGGDDNGAEDSGGAFDALGDLFG